MSTATPAITIAMTAAVLCNEMNEIEVQNLVVCSGLTDSEQNTFHE